MPFLQLKRHSLYSAREMFDLVADVARYPEFLPMCLEISIKDNLVHQQSFLTLIVEMKVGYGTLRESFTSAVRLNADKHEIQADYVAGPLRVLENRWKFTPDPKNPEKNCTIDFSLRYEFKTALWAWALKPFSESGGRKFVAAFQKRAEVVYGRSKH